MGLFFFCTSAAACSLVWFILRPCQHDNGYIDGRSQIKVHTDKRTQVHSAQPSLAVTHPGTNRARRYLTSVIESPSNHWSPPRCLFYFGRLVRVLWEV